MKKKLNHFKNNKSKETKEKRLFYSTHAKYLLDKALDYCNSEASLSRIATTLQQEMESNLQEVRACHITIKTLLENDYVGWQDVDNSEMRATSLRTNENNKDRMWEEYRELLLDQFANISKKAAERDRDFSLGAITHLVTFLDYTFK